MENAGVTFCPCGNCRKMNRVDRRLGGARQAICASCRGELPIHGWICSLGSPELELLVARSPLPVVVDFWSPHCMPCQSFASTFEDGALQLAGRAVFVKVNVERDQEAARTHRIHSVPTVVLYQGGSESARQAGSLSLGPFVDWIHDYLTGRAA